MNSSTTHRRLLKILLDVAATAIVATSLSGPARASTILRLTDLTSGEQQIVIDEGRAGVLSDSDLAATADDFAAGYPGTVMRAGPVGSFDVAVTTGSVQPSLGTSGGGRIDLVSLVVSGGSGELQIELTATGFQVAPSHTTAELESSVGGTTDGIVSAEAYADPEDREFGTSISAGLLGPFEPASQSPASDTSFAGFAGTPLSLEPGKDFSITQRFVVRHPRGSGDEVTSFDATARVHAPEPAALAMCGAALAWLCLLTWRRRR